jgi:hypothetical protein
MKRRSPSVRLFLIVLLIIVAAAGLWVFGMLHHTCPYGEPCDPATKGWLWTTPVSVTGLVLGGGLTVVGVRLRRRP